MQRYAAHTSVSVEKSRAEIEQLVTRAGASEFQSGWMSNQAAIMFTLKNRQVRFVMDLPDRASREFMYTPERRKLRSQAEREKAYEQACRSRWRALLLAIKAKLEAIQVGISTFDQEFLAFIVDPRTDRTVAELIAPQLALVYAGPTDVPLSLPGPDAT